MLVLVAILSIVTLATIRVLLNLRAKTRHMMQFSEKIPGPKQLPIIGNILDVGWKPEDLLQVTYKHVTLFGPLVRIWLGPLLFIAITDPKHVEVIMSSNDHIVKSLNYNNLLPWLGTGLLTSSGKKWRAHRKMLTPSFHFKILEQFTEVFNSNGDIMISRLSSHVDGPQFDVTSYVVMCTLDVICESAMGVNVKAQTGAGQEYASCVCRIGNVITERSMKPWLYSDTLYALSTLKTSQDGCLKVLHGTTNSVIRKRKQELLAERAAESTKQSNEQESVLGSKRHMNFLDLLLQTSQNGEPLTDEEIREEVDTFMFEGHDTTASCCLSTLWVLAKHQDIQSKAAAELRTIFGDSDRVTTFSDLQEMKYLERVIKESLRLYPSVPMMGRMLTKDVTVGDYVFPAGSNIVFLPYATHRRPENFPEPEKFDPDRFLPENCVGRHPYSYIPFSAGPRNCIGQKFAMLELKSLLSKLLRNYTFCLGNPAEELDVHVELVLRSRNGIQLKIARRD